MESLCNYIENNVEPTLSYAKQLVRAGEIDEVTYMRFVSSLTEVFEDYGETVDELMEKLYSEFMSEVELD